MHILRHLNIRNVRRKKTSVLNIDNGTKNEAETAAESFCQTLLGTNLLHLLHFAKILHIRQVFLHVQTNQRAVVELS